MTSQRPIRIATRRSRLAMAQSNIVGDQLSRSTGRTYQLVPVATAGDDTSKPVDELGGTGVFVATVRQCVLAGDADLAVHSMKDLPTASAPGLVLAAVPVRHDARDALCSNGVGLAELPIGARVGTGSPRRVAQLRAARADLRFEPMRGNVDTRLGKVADGSMDAVVLAVAGLQRLERTDAITETLEVSTCVPAPAQGALAVEAGAELDDEQLLAALAGYDHAASRAAVVAERRLLAVLEAGCTAPLGAHAVVVGDQITMTAVVADISGATVLRMSEKGPAAAPDQCGELLADRLLAAGAADLVGGRIP